MNRCKGSTLKGGQCKRSCEGDSEYCYQHGSLKSSERAKNSLVPKGIKSPRSPQRVNHSSSKERSERHSESVNGKKYDGEENRDLNSLSVSAQRSPEKSLYERLGGIFAIAAVVDRFSEDILDSPLVGVESPNPQLREWSRSHQEDRLPGLKWMRTLWVADITGGPYKFIPTKPGSTPLGLENAHKKFKISPEEFDEVARILVSNLKYFKVPEKEGNEVVTAFMAHKPEVTMGFYK